MPNIHFRSYAGKDDETKLKTAQALVKAAQETMGAPENAFTFIWEDMDRDTQKVIAEYTLIDHGKVVV